jgi:uncharacterized repeat protein (TIGR03803 family)
MAGRIVLRTTLAGLLLGALAAAIAPAQTYTTLVSFTQTDGAAPYAGLIQATDGNLYGTTVYGGTGCPPFGCGTVYRITPGGGVTTVYSFCAQSGCEDGSNPYAALLQTTDGDFYGTTGTGGANDLGTFFKITASGTLTTLHSFTETEGALPVGALIQAANGYFYGTTSGGGASGFGTVFKTTPSGTLTTLHSFAGSDGSQPDAGLIQGTNGDLYGTTFAGGANGEGTVFQMTPEGSLTTLYSFNGIELGSPAGRLVQAPNGDFYGTTSGDGTDGTVFKITPSGTLTTLYTFTDGLDGGAPYAGLVQGTDHNFYGTTFNYGAYLGGTIFKITPKGDFTTIYTFCSEANCVDGSNSWVNLVQDTDGDFYGVTAAGGSDDLGTVFSLSVGLGPFVKTRPTYGEVGAAVKILGTNLTGATGVMFNGIADPFSVVSPSEITTSVPAGATTGSVEVTTPNGTLTSNIAFKILP